VQKIVAYSYRTLAVNIANDAGGVRIKELIRRIVSMTVRLWSGDDPHMVANSIVSDLRIPQRPRQDLSIEFRRSGKFQGHAFVTRK
jgi:hypothetical protein